MSSPPKRLHEDGGHSTPSKHPFEETGFCFSMVSVNNDLYQPLEQGQERRLAKVQRVEPHDIDRKPCVLHHMPSASISSIDHQIASENRFESNRSQDARDVVKSEDREVKADNADLNTDRKIDLQVSWAENHLKIDFRVDDKESRSDKGSNIDCRYDKKIKKNDYSAAGSHLSKQDAKEHQRGRNFYEPPTDGLDAWRLARASPQATDEVAKYLPNTEQQDPIEACEDLRENKGDLRGEDSFREKVRRRGREFPEKEKDKNGCRNYMLPSGPSMELKELQSKERDPEKWVGHNNDVLKDTVQNEREKDSGKRELPTINGKEKLHCEQGIIDVSARPPEQKNMTIEHKKSENDGSKAYYKGIKDEMREKAGSFSLGDNCEQQIKPYEADDGCPEGDRALGKEKEVRGGVQQRRRMPRSRTSPQVPQREPRFRSRMHENDGSQGKPEISMVIYKAGECLQELLNLWKEFEACQDDILQNSPTLEVRIPAEYVTSTNRQA